MDLNEPIRDFVREQAEKRGWTSNADLARNIGFTEATWSRIMRLKQKTIKDNVANLICKAFHVTPVELLLISEGKKHSTILGTKTHYHTKNDRLHRLCEWLEHEAKPEQREAIFATATAFGFPNGSTNSSHSGRAASRSVAGAA